MDKPGIKRIALDIGSSSVKLLELTKENGSLKISKAALVGFKRSEQSSRVDAICSIIKGYDPKEVLFRTSISGPSVIIRYIWLPQMNKDELRSAVKFESEKYIPFSPEEVIIDSQLVEEDKATKRVRILLVAVKKDFMDGLLKLLSDCQIKLEFIDVDSFCLANAFSGVNPKSEKEKNVALVDIGSRYTNVHIMQGELSYFSRDIAVAGDNFTTAISEKTGLDLTESEKLKLASGDREGEVKGAIAPVIEELAGEIRLCFDYFENQFEKSVESLQMTGGSSESELMRKLIESALGIETIRWQPLKDIEIDPAVDKKLIPGLNSRLSVALGLALRDK